MAKRKSESFQREKPHASKRKVMIRHTHDHNDELSALVRMRDADIDTSDMPEVRN